MLSYSLYVTRKHYSSALLIKSPSTKVLIYERDTTSPFDGFPLDKCITQLTNLKYYGAMSLIIATAD